MTARRCGAREALVEPSLPLSSPKASIMKQAFDVSGVLTFETSYKAAH